MKKILVFVLAISVPFFAAADETAPKHIISIGTNGLGWSAVGNVFEWDKNKSSGIKDQNTGNGTIALNYNYVFKNQMMVGANIYYESDKSETKLASGDKINKDSMTSTFSVSVGYNFNEDIVNSWWLKGSIGSGGTKIKRTDTTATPEKTKSDIGLNFVALEGGKRISLDSWGLKNFSYSPSIAVASTTFDEDAGDVGLESSVGVTLNVLKFDIAF
jgi:hypothetical protein